MVLVLIKDRVGLGAIGLMQIDHRAAGGAVGVAAVFVGFRP